MKVERCQPSAPQSPDVSPVHLSLSAPPRNTPGEPPTDESMTDFGLQNSRWANGNENGYVDLQRMDYFQDPGPPAVAPNYMESLPAELHPGFHFSIEDLSPTMTNQVPGAYRPPEEFSFYPAAEVGFRGQGKQHRGPS